MYEIENDIPEIEEQTAEIPAKNTLTEEAPVGEPAFVPLAALQKERQKRRQMRDPLTQQKFEVADKLSEKTGKSIGELINEIDSFDNSPVHNDKNIENDYSDEIELLSKNPIYADIHENRDEIARFAAAKGVSLKEAYNALYAERRIDDISKIIEQRVLNDLSKKHSRRISALPGGSASDDAPVIDLSAAELRIASAAGITPTDYHKYKQRGN